MHAIQTRWRGIQAAARMYPHAFWVLFGGTLLNRIGESMIWPFLTVFMRDRLDIAVAKVTFLLTLQAIASIIATSITGVAVDRFGRKNVMLISLLGNSGVFIAMLLTQQFWLWAIILMVKGALDPMYKVGSQSMVADIVGEDLRSKAYALKRTAANVGVSIGPVIGGVLVLISYAPIFIGAAVVMLIYTLIILRYVPETIPVDDNPKRAFGYISVLKDQLFVTYCLIYIMALMPYILMMTLMPVYMKDEFQIPEAAFGGMLTMNAIMVVLMQYGITRYSDRYPALITLVIGSGFSTAAMLLMGVAQTVSVFVAAMFVLTIAEMLLVPTATTFAANLAPTDKRGRYMSLYTLTWGVGQAVGLSAGGVINDTISPVAVWYAAALLNAVAIFGFWWLQRRTVRRTIASVAAAMD